MVCEVSSSQFACTVIGLAGVRKEFAEAAGERFQRVKEEMKKRDKEDRLAEKERLREKRMKEKRKAWEKSVESEEDGPRLGAGSPGKTGASDSDEEEEEEDGPMDQKKHWSSSRRESSDQDVSGSEEDFGSEDESSLRQSPSAHRKDMSRKKVSKLSVEEQEALARKLLGSKG